ncbi:hypothetical protein [Burkholderia cepacia]|uniref:hypothetical protein n=1 Tax=Burkholderia cepacia TaxID=292 RepID=UPI002FDF7075
MNPTEFIRTSKRLTEIADCEGDLRSAVSRAYYGALHACLDALPTEFAPTTERMMQLESHRAVIDAMEVWGRLPGAGRLNAQFAARAISKLKRSRVNADYRIVDQWMIDATQCIAEAERIVDLVSEARAQRDKAKQG